MSKIFIFLGRSLNSIASYCLKKEAKLILKMGREHFFIEHTMDPEFNYKPYKKISNPYFKTWGFDFSMLEAAYYERVNGVKSNYYIPCSLFSHYIIPYLNGDVNNIDKNLYRLLLGVKNQNSKYKFYMANQIIYNRNGYFYLGNDEPCSLEEAVDEVLTYKKDIIVKPTMDSTWGRGVIKLSPNIITEKVVRNIIAQYKKNFSFEECIVQHPDMATLNDSSLNTTRITTYRKPNGEIKFLFSFQRFGAKGAVVDNASAGGYFCGVEDDGTLNRVIYSYKSLKTMQLNTEVVEKIPFFFKMKEVAIYLHSKIPDANYIGWDFSITPNGIPVVIEFNRMSSVDPIQIAKGPAFSKEDLDELMPYIAKWKVSCKAEPRIRFRGKKNSSAKVRY